MSSSFYNWRSREPVVRERRAAPVFGPCPCLTRLVVDHEGHCCFFPAETTCHPAEFAAWEAQRGGSSA